MTKLVNNDEILNYNSVLNYNWFLLKQDDYLVQNLIQKTGINEILARILINRGIVDPEDAIKFLSPKLRDTIPDPDLFLDMGVCVERIYKAILNKEKITILGDYDVDGATSSALFRRFFDEIGIEVSVYIPHRIEEGYGPSPKIFDKIKANNSTLVITTDCGMVAFEALEYAKKIGLDVIIVDHHLQSSSLPSAVAIVNPNRIDDNFPYKYLAAVGVAFFVVLSLRKKLRDEGWFSSNKILEPDLREYMDLVALGTVCDVMPLTNVNRLFVKHGLEIIKKRKNIGINAITKLINLDAKIQSYHLGFVFGPRINAGGRVGEGYLGSNLLSTKDEIEAYEIAQKLELLNNERKAIELMATNEAIQRIESDKEKFAKIIIIQGENWHLGILGILASRIKERYNKLSIILSLINDDIIKGSARSVVGINIGQIIGRAKEQEILLEGGGHSMAAGFSLKREKMDHFQDFLHNYLNDYFNNSEDFNLSKRLEIDACLDIGGINTKLLNDISKAEPFGQGNMQPKFLIKNVMLVKSIIVGENHVMSFIRDQYQMPSNRKRERAYKQNNIKLIAFRAVNSELGDFLLNNQGKFVHIVGNLNLNNLNNNVEIVLNDIALA